VFGDLLRGHRLAVGLTQDELAESSGLSVRAVADMERGRSARPYRRSVALLAGALGLSGEDGALFAKTARAGTAIGSPAGQPGLARAAAAVPAPVAQRPAVHGPVVPRQLPPAVPGFIGRAGELAALDGLPGQAAGAGGTVVISAIGGTAGVGKTALAVQWGHRVAHLFPDGQLYVNLRGFGPADAPAMTAAEAIRLLLDGIGVAPARIPADPDAQVALYRSMLSGRRMLIFLDNARDPAQVRPLLPGSQSCLVLVTSRNQLTGLAVTDGAHPLILDVLAQEEACDLLARRLGPERVMAEPDAASELIRLCARLPLALAIAAGRAAARPALPLEAMVAELRGTPAWLDALATGDAATDVRTVFSWSCQQLSEPAARMFRLLGVHPGPDITIPAAASLAGISLSRAGEALRELARAHLITEDVAGRYAFHDLLRAYAAERARSQDGDSGCRMALERVLDHYLHTACAAALLLYPNRDLVTLNPPRPEVRPEALADREQALAWFQAERQVLLAAIKQAADGGFRRHAWQLPWAVAIFLGLRGHWREVEVTQLSALASARHLGDLAGQAQAHRFLGKALGCRGAHADARTHLSAALELGRQLGSLALQARVHIDLAWAVGAQGSDQLSHGEQALGLYRMAGHRSGEADALNVIGWQHAQLGRYQETLNYCGQALALQRQLADPNSAVATLDSLGYAHHHLGQYGEAIACYQQAINTHGEAGDLSNLGEMLAHLGDAQQATGDREAARRVWQQSLAILDDLRHPDATGVRDKLGKLATAK